jgi:hypothetical protein
MQDLAGCAQQCKAAQEEAEAAAELGSNKCHSVPPEAKELHSTLDMEQL